MAEEAKEPYNDLDKGKRSNIVDRYMRTSYVTLISIV